MQEPTRTGDCPSSTGRLTCGQITRRSLLTLSLLFAAACASGDGRHAVGAPAPDRDCSQAIVTGDGPVLGHVSHSGQSCEFLGIRYAVAPVGDLRFANPRPLPKPAGMFFASWMGNTCLQKFAIKLEAIDAELSTRGDEDCLFLNIWSPGGEKLPVMVYIHGGGFVIGSGTTHTYNGDLLAQENVVVVTLNYRLGPLGFFYYPGLITEGGSAGNQGILDQILALQWVRDNIGQFGGDMSNVTIFGESAGGMSVCTLLASPEARGLFHAAIIQSGGCKAVAEPATGFARAVSYAAEAGCAGAPDLLQCMRAVPPAELIEKLKFDPLSAALQPHIDGKVLIETPLDAIRGGRFNRVPLLTGSNANEVQALALADPHYLTLKRMPWSEYNLALGATFGPADGRQLAALYGPERFDTPYDSWFTLKSDYILGCPSLLGAQAVAAQSVPAFHYIFSWKDMGAVSRAAGAFHGLDLYFVFGNFGLLSTVIPFETMGAAHELSANMRRAWTTFARTHTPSAAGLPAWPEVTTGTMMLDYEAVVDPRVKRDVCKFWDTRLPTGLENQTGHMYNLVFNVSN